MLKQTKDLIVDDILKESVHGNITLANRMVLTHDVLSVYIVKNRKMLPSIEKGGIKWGYTPIGETKIVYIDIYRWEDKKEKKQWKLTKEEISALKTEAESKVTILVRKGYITGELELRLSEVVKGTYQMGTKKYFGMWEVHNF
jgi:hypothetical protein